jgi:hypothetical protein
VMTTAAAEVSARANRRPPVGPTRPGRAASRADSFLTSYR